MGPGKCGRLWEVDAYREGRLGEKDAASFERHARSCAACGAKLASDERLGQMARELAERDAPSPLALRRLRVRVLRDVATGVGAAKEPPAWSRWRLVAAVACVVAVVAAAAIGRRGRSLHDGSSTHAAGAAAATPAAASARGEEPQVYAGSVAELGEARWTQSRDGDVERVALTGGCVRVHVRPQRPAERFLVTMPDGEIEVRGTTFDVTVAGARTARVHVDEGVVDLRLAGRDEVRLLAGDTWTAPGAAPAPIATAVAAPGTATATRVPTPVPTAAASAAAPSAGAIASVPAPSADEGEAAYAAAVGLLQGGRNAEAAAALQAFLIAHPKASQAEDASYLEAVALARAGRVDAAALAAEQHLARFPGSFHRREAEALIARARVSGSR